MRRCTAVAYCTTWCVATICLTKIPQHKSICSNGHLRELQSKEHPYLYSWCSNGYKTRQALYVQRNSGARSCNHCCSGQKISITFLPLQSACAMLYYPWPVWLYSIFPHYLVNSTIFGKKSLNIKCVFFVCVRQLCETFLILRRIWQNIIINVHRSTCKETVIFVRF